MVGGLAACSYIFESTLPESIILPTTNDGAPNPEGDDGGCADIECDGGPISDANPFDATIPFCPNAGPDAAYCSDFDLEPFAELGTFGTARSTNGRLELAQTVSFSPKRSLLSTVTGAGFAVLAGDAGGAPSEMTMASSVLVTAYTATEAKLATLRITDGGATACTVWLGTSGANYNVTQLCTNNGAESAKLVTDTGRAIQRGRWQRFVLTLKLAPTKTLTVDIDNVRVADVAALDAIVAAPTEATFGPLDVVGGDVILFQDNLLVTTP